MDVVEQETLIAHTDKKTGHDRIPIMTRH